MNNLSLTLNGTLSFTTTGEYIGVRVFEQNDGLLGMILCIYYIAYIISMIICFTSIFVYYLPDKNLLYSIKLCCIVCTICYGIGNTAWTLNLHCSLVTTSWLPRYRWKDICYGTTETIASYSMAFGYCFLVYSFWIRIVNAFKDSLFEISPKTDKILKIFLSLCILSLFISLIFTIIFHTMAKNIWIFFLVSLVLLVLNMILYITTSIIIVKLMFNKIRQFSQFVATSQEIDVEINSNNNNSNSTGNKCTTNRSNSVQHAAHVLIKLLTVLYTVALISSTIILLIIIISVVVMMSIGSNDTGTGKGSFWRTNMATYMFFAFFRLLFMTDSIINCLCLLLQNKRARHLYPKLCFCCKKLNCLQMHRV